MWKMCITSNILIQKAIFVARTYDPKNIVGIFTHCLCYKGENCKGGTVHEVKMGLQVMVDVSTKGLTQNSDIKSKN